MGVAQAREHGRGDFDINRIVIHDEDALRVQRSGQIWFGRAADRRKLGGRAAHAEAKRGTRAGCTLDADLSMHQGHDVFADHQAQPCAPIDAGRRCVALGERLKQVGQAGRGDTDPCVGDAEPQQARVSGLIEPHPQGHFALGGEFDGIGEQVEQHLAQAHLIAQHGLGHVGSNLQRKVQAFLFGLDPHDVARGSDRGANAQGLLL